MRKPRSTANRFAAKPVRCKNTAARVLRTLTGQSDPDIWKAGEGVLQGEPVKGEIIRLRPPHYAEPDVVERIAESLRERGAVVRTLPREKAPGIAQTKVDAAKAGTIRETVMSVADAVQSRNKPVLMELVSGVMAEEGL